MAALGVLLSGNGRPAWGSEGTLTVVAAADLMPILPRLVREFSEKTHIPVRVSYGSSGEAAIKIRHHAPFDLFLSADAAFPETLSREGRVLGGSVKTYATGVLVLWVSRSIIPRSASPTLSLLAGPQVKKIALANPRLAPYGRAALRCLRSRNLWVGVRGKVVYGNSLAQVAQYLRTGSADAGFLSGSQAKVLSRQDRGGVLTLSPSCVPYLEQKMAVVTNSRHVRDARAFENFLLEESTRNILKSRGYH
jgi:molybdate transport system substrate-binding protein